MFERKLENSKLRSEIQTSSNGHELIETDFFKGADTINKRIDTLERRVIKLENASTDERKSETDETDSKIIPTQDEMDLQSIVRNTLKDEKIERVNFIANVQNQIKSVNERISLFMNTTDVFLEDQLKMLSTKYDLFEYNSSKAFSEFKNSVEDLSQNHVTEMEGSMNLIQESMTELERHVSMNFEDLTIKITKTMNDKILKTEAEMIKLNEDMANLNIIKEKESSAIGSLEANISDLTAVVENSKEMMAELQGQFNTHLRSSERLFSKVGKEIGTCDKYGLQWKQNGKKCYGFMNYINSWYGAKTDCSSFKGQLLTIDSKEENDFITKSLIRGFGISDYWIGIHQTENGWEWSSPERNRNPVRFTNWAWDEPNHGRGRCGSMLRSGKWKASDCGHYYTTLFICEADTQL